METQTTIRLNVKTARVFEGSPWIYRGQFVPPKDNEGVGSLVTVVDSHNRFVGRGFYNPQSVIAIRLLTRRHDETIDGPWFARKIRSALHSRASWIGSRDAYRVVNSEADGIAGLIVDKYGPMLVIEVLSRGLVPFMPEILDTLVNLMHPTGIYERGDVPVRDREGLPRTNQLVFGRMESPVFIHEHGVTLSIDLTGGQKTGHFLDQYENRGRVASMAAGKVAFDAFCHTGGFGLAAAYHGATSLVEVDIDEAAIAQARRNATANGLSERMTFITANAFDWLRTASVQGSQFDLGVLDPPAFTKSRDAVAGALKGYKEINLRAIKLIRPGGILVTSSCSYHVSEADFIGVVGDAAKDAKRHVKIMEIRGQGPDHPILPALPESRYLKCLILEVGE
ncbi:MAG: class I SAM-dependent rRNA methyltransferase [Firmicutes bacterium]|nr:class I SAM-dependent rRNA methyltransferase [Bacillota bacterium]